MAAHAEFVFDNPRSLVPTDLALTVGEHSGTFDLDDIVPISQSRDYVAAAAAAGAAAGLTEVAGDHFTLIDPESDAWRQTLTILAGL